MRTVRWALAISGNPHTICGMGEHHGMFRFRFGSRDPSHRLYTLQMDSPLPPGIRLWSIGKQEDIKTVSFLLAEMSSCFGAVWDINTSSPTSPPEDWEPVGFLRALAH